MSERRGVPLPRIGRLRAMLGRARAVPGRVDAIDERLRAIDAELHALYEQAGAVQHRIDAQLDQARNGSDEARRSFAELRDSVHLVARRTTARRRPTRVLFLVHLLGVWDSSRALIEAMAASEDFEPIVASVPRRFRGADRLYGEEDVHRGLLDQGVPHLRFSAEGAHDVLRLIKSIEPDVIFRQSQWDADVPDELGTERLAFARTCLIPYETVNIVVNVPSPHTVNTAVDSDYHRGAWLVFCANQRMLDAAVRDGARAGAQFRVVGHPKADYLRSVSPAWPLGEAADPDHRPGRVCWSAHHSIATGWTDFGAFHLIRESMLDWARERSDLQFVFLPHPALLPFPDSEYSPINRADFDAWMRDWSALPNTAVLSEAAYGPTLAASDVMVTDGLSMLVEYQLLGKPVVFFERAGHRPFNPIGEQVVRGVHPVHTASDARMLAEKFLAGHPDPLRRRQQDIMRELFGPPGSVERIMDTLRHELARERGAAAVDPD